MDDDAWHGAAGISDLGWRYGEQSDYPQPASQPQARIFALRDQLDQATAHQFINGQSIDNKIARLLEQQVALSARQDKLGHLQRLHPGSRQAILDQVATSLKALESNQLTHVETLTGVAALQLTALESVFEEAGISDTTADTIGGPFNEPQMDEPFDASLTRLGSALGRLDALSHLAGKMPFANPAPGKAVSSVFGNRVDPFFKRVAHHAGIDFKTPSGEAIHATGGGTVTLAENAGSYDNMVEIDHGSGISSRYGHLSSLLVKVGDGVDVHTIIGLSGSTGRSTGPHLHYELRREGVAIDPMTFLNAGLKLAKYKK